MPLRPLFPFFALAATWLWSAANSRAAEIVAHRGASHDAPENTVRSAKLAWKDGADAVELDIHLTKDGKLAVLHDFNTKRITGRDAEIALLTLAEIKELDAGKWKGPEFAGEKIPTLDELLATIPAGKRMFIEIKTGPEIIPALKEALARTHTGPDKAILISFKFASLQAAKAQLPGYQTMWLVGYKKANAATKTPPPPTLDEIIKGCQTAKLDGLDLQSTWPLGAADVKRIKAAGLQLHVWTVDDPAVARKWIGYGVDSVTSNRPGWMREQLAAK